MKKAQPIKFNNIEELLSYLPDKEKGITITLRNLVLQTLPYYREKLSYNVPFYYYHSRICFIWPASIPWGNVDEGVAFGFCRGHLLNDEWRYLQLDNRKSVARKVFKEKNDIEPDVLKMYLLEAWEIDKQLKK